MTQFVLDNEFYFIDLPEMIRKTKQKQAADELRTLHRETASKGRQIEKEDYSKFIKSLQDAAGLSAALEEESFSRDKMEELRAFTNKMNGSA